MRNSIELGKIRIDGGTQPRADIDYVTVDEYADSMERFEPFPEIVVYFDGANHWLADGFHRYHGAAKAGMQAIDAEVRTGTIDDAKFYASGANGAHGLKRKEGDKRRALLMLLETKQGRAWISGKGKSGSGLKAIAQHLHVSQSWVTSALAEIHPEQSPGRDAKRAAIAREIDASPSAPDREIARRVGVNHETVGNVRRNIASRAEATVCTEPEGSAPTAKVATSKPVEVKDHQPIKAPHPITLESGERLAALAASFPCLASIPGCAPMDLYEMARWRRNWPNKGGQEPETVNAVMAIEFIMWLYVTGIGKGAEGKFCVYLKGKDTYAIRRAANAPSMNEIVDNGSEATRAVFASWLGDPWFPEVA